MSAVHCGVSTSSPCKRRSQRMRSSSARVEITMRTLLALCLCVRTVALAAEQLVEMDVQIDLWDSVSGGKAGKRGSGEEEQKIVIQDAIDQIRSRWGVPGIARGTAKARPDPAARNCVIVR